MDLFKLLGTISINNSDANQALDDTSKKGRDTESKLSKAFSAVGKGAVVVGKVIGTGLAVGGAAMGALTIKALNLSGDLEQNMGGSEAVFKEYAGKMQETAKGAFENMGLSTSDFLATANKMGALFQGAGFDIQESADLSSKAMQRAADVASIMGIDTASAMEAIAGAAKGNFTMMDNLGVAMNDTTLQAYALEKGINKSTQEMTNQEKISLAMEMFLEKTAYAAGNYAKENKTLAGSLATAKAALKNFLDGSGDVDQMVNAFSNAANVIIKNLSEIGPRLVSGLSEAIQKITPMIPSLLNQLLPVIIDSTVSLITSLAGILPQLVPILTDSVIPALLQAVLAIGEALIGALPSIAEAICSALPTLLPMLIDGIVSMIVMLCSNFSQIIQPIIDNLPAILISVVDALFQNLPILIEGAVRLVVGVVAALPQIIISLIEAMPTVIMSMVRGLLSAAPALIQGMKDIWNTVASAVLNICNGIKNAISKVWNGIKNVVSNAVNAVKSTVSNVFNGIKSTVTNIWNGIMNAIKKPIEKARDIVKSAIDKIKGFFKFKFEWPKIKMPHFGISPSGWKIGDLLKGSIPKLKIDWYAEGGIMKKPTLFDYNPATGTAKVGGEAGDEAVAPINTLQQYIRDAVKQENSGMVGLLERVISLLTQFFPEMLEALNIQMYLDTGVLVAESAPAMDAELGKIAMRKGRGRG